jgi:hypothetical protein
MEVEYGKAGKPELITPATKATKTAPAPAKKTTSKKSTKK